MKRRMAALGYEISTQDFSILFRLLKRGSMTQVEISSLLMRDKTTITRRIDGLVKKKYVQRKPCPDDRRFYLIELTSSGKQTVEALIPLVANFQREVVSGIPDEDKVTTLNTLQHISKLLISIKP